MHLQITALEVRGHMDPEETNTPQEVSDMGLTPIGVDILSGAIMTYQVAGELDDAVKADIEAKLTQILKQSGDVNDVQITFSWLDEPALQS